jgi:hypothetical protein
MAKYTDDTELVDELLMNGQKVELKNPGTKALADYLKVARDFGKAGKDLKAEEAMSYLSDSGIDSMVRLVDYTLESSFPEMWRDKNDELKAWGMQNSMTILFKVLEMCTPANKSIEDAKKQKMMERLSK